MAETSGPRLTEEVTTILGGAKILETNLKITESKSASGSHPVGEATDRDVHIGGPNS